jgi:organic hydroperoxide reductase OsmC/OhrA
MSSDEAETEDTRVQVRVDWKRGQGTGVPGEYSREHHWHFAGLVLKVTDALSPDGYRDTAQVDPLQAYVATISSAHMLEWLYTAIGLGVDVESYVDDAEGVLSERADGRSWVSEVILRPQVTFGAGMGMSEAAIERMHKDAIKASFIAGSVKTKITIAGA